MRELTSYNHLLYLLYGHLSPCDSLRDICLCIDNHKDIIYHCGFNKSVDSTTLSRANKSRSYKILEELGYYLISIISNNFDFSAIDIANIYRNRWQIEVFFKWIKQNVVIKKLWGYSENAVKTHLWSALCAYLIMVHVKAEFMSRYTITEILTLVRGALFEKRDLKELLTKPTKITNPESNQNVYNRFLICRKF